VTDSGAPESDLEIFRTRGVRVVRAPIDPADLQEDNSIAP